jgi:hypothetical protein
VTLLMVAEEGYPKPAALPPDIDPDALDKLTRVGLVSVDGDHYQMRGLIAERERRAESARGSANARWRVDANASERMRTHANDAKPSETMLERERERERDATSVTNVPDVAHRAREGDANASERIADDFIVIARLAERLTSTPYVLSNRHSKMGERVLSLIARHGVAEVERGFNEASALVLEQRGKMPDIRQLLFAAGDLLDPPIRVEPRPVEEEAPPRRREPSPEAKALAERLTAEAIAKGQYVGPVRDAEGRRIDPSSRTH